MITNLGGKVSTAKSLFGTMLGQGQSISTEFFQDEITKNFLADYAAEHFEIASYKALIATAEQIGEHQCIPVLREILREEEAMARWLEEHLPLAVRIGLEKTTSENYGRRRQSSGVYGKIKQNQALSTVVIGGTIGMVALYLMRNNQDQHQRHIEKVRTIPHRSVEGVAGQHISVATDESGSPTAEIPTSNNLTRAARGNS
jgi:hypothetical protein